MRWNLLIICFIIAGFVVGCQSATQEKTKKPKVVFIIVDGIAGDVIQKLNPPVLAEISKAGGFTLAHVGGGKGTYSETPTISAVGYNSLLTGTWANKHNVWDNDIAAPNYNYWNLFRIARASNPALKTAVFSTWEDNRTKLIGEGLQQAGNISVDYKFDGLEHDTVKYPHDTASVYIQRIDVAVSDEAAKVISAEGPDLSWVYLEFTDDMGHKFGDSPQFHDAIMAADKQIGKIWDAIKKREKELDEDWLIVITTDHGRDATTGQRHGGQSDRERSTWIVTNAKERNARFDQNPGIVDIFPTICYHLGIQIPDDVRREVDGIPFIGPLDLTELTAQKSNGKILLSWKSLDKNSAEKAEIFITETNNFKEGGKDDYRKVGEVSLKEENFELDLTDNSDFYKILVKTPNQYANVWVTKNVKQ
ncbi:MAG TPA: alkaline phosphatase family protein [Chryseolinea sp.]|nr:alkaline phosphatase family protein [Chryseolinea sp.]